MSNSYSAYSSELIEPAKLRPRSPGLRLFSKVVCGAVVFLIFMGALVTSNEAGLAVPDWPTSFGDNMFLFPPSKWIGIIFFEHVHRLVASVVGILTIILFVWILKVDRRRWVKMLAGITLLSVILQGVLGGLTVLYKLPLAISSMHGVLGQIFLVLTIILAYSQSRELEERTSTAHTTGSARLFRYSSFLLIVIFMQLAAGALMRHSEAGLAVPDFPLMAGSAIPSTSTATIGELNSMRASLRLPPVNAVQVTLHLVHRLGAILVFAAALVLLCKGISAARETDHKFAKSSAVHLLYFVGYLVVIQFFLGAFSVWSVRQPVVTSLHVVTGAMLMGVTALLCLKAYPFKKTAKASAAG
ncbi:MAG: COX15/CtaA family protein [Deltaproteobacteria bacterium]|nr:COX15/CtaA family protein [Deltaproteobacteria bacterium]